MSSGGVKYKAQTYDPSTYEAEMQMKRMELTDQVTKRAYGAAKKANVYSDRALASMQDGLGLLSNYVYEQIYNAQDTNEIAREGLGDIMDVRARALAGAGFLTGAAESYYKQAEEADAQFNKELKQSYSRTGG